MSRNADFANIPESGIENLNLRKLIAEREVMLSIASASVKDRASLLDVINSKIKQVFYFTHSVLLLAGGNSEYVTAFLLDPDSLSKKYPDYNRIVSGRIPANDGILNVLLGSDAPVVIDIEQKANEGKSPDYIKMGESTGLKFFAGIPLRKEDQTMLGVLCLYTDKSEGFNEETLKLMNAMSGHISVAVENILGHEEIERRDRENEIIFQISNKMIAVKEKCDFLDIVNHELKKHIPYDDNNILLYNKERKTYGIYSYHVLEKRLNDPVFQTMMKMEYLDTNIRRVSHLPEVSNVEDLMIAGNEWGKVIFQMGVRQVLFLKLIDGDKVLGQLVLLSEAHDFFTENHLSLLQKLSYQLSKGLANIIANEQIETKEKNTQLLLSLSAVMDKVKNRNDLLYMIRNKLSELISFTDIAISLYKPGTHTYQIFAHQVQEKRERHQGFMAVITPEYPVKDGIHDVALSAAGPVVIGISDAMSSPDRHSGTQFLYESGIKKMLLIKLTYHDEILGFLNILSEDDNAFEDINHTILKGVTDQLSTAITNILAHEEIQKKDKENDIVLTISGAISNLVNRESVIYIIMNQLRSFLHFNDICISYYDLEKGSYRIFTYEGDLVCRDPDFVLIENAEFPIDDGIHNVLIDSENVVYFSYERLKSMDMPHINFMLRTGIREIACVRLINNNEIIGALVLSSDRDHSFVPEYYSLIERISHHLATGVSNIVANEKLEIREREKASLLSEKSLLLSFSSDITAVRSRNELSQVIYTRLLEMIHYDEFVIALIDETNSKHYPYLHVFAGQSIENPDYEQFTKGEFLIQDGFFDKLLKENYPVVIHLKSVLDVGNAPDYLQFDYDNGIREIVGVPIREGSKTLGMFFILLRQPGNWNQAALRLVQGISYQLSIAVANLLANERIEEQLQEINNYRQRLEEEKHYLQEEASIGYSYSDIIGSGEEMQKVFHLLSQVAFSNSTVLLLGETGTGKELIARTIHNSSSRKDKLMVKVNCAALPANLIESELFGHERGSFTGATERRLGKFELANQGTLFLDEIGEMPLDLQVKLLRAIQEREIERVGGKGTIKVDVRIIAATNRNLKKEVEEGRFRGDLYYRLNVFPITLPPLREHKEDIPVLVNHFINKYAKNSGKKISQISGSAMKDLMAYSWPGNVRELEHLIERSILMTQGNIIKEMHLPKLRVDDAGMLPKDAYLKTHEENERDYIIEVLNGCNGKIFGVGGAAQVLNLKVGTLNSKIKKLGIQKEQTVFRRG